MMGMYWFFDGCSPCSCSKKGAYPRNVLSTDLLFALQIYMASFWMGKLGGNTPKRHKLWSNSDFISKISDKAGYMSKEERQQLTGASLVDKYLDKNGKKRMVGNKNLKNSQSVPHFHLPRLCIPGLLCLPVSDLVSVISVHSASCSSSCVFSLSLFAPFASDVCVSVDADPLFHLCCHGVSCAMFPLKG